MTKHVERVARTGRSESGSAVTWRFGAYALGLMLAAGALPRLARYDDGLFFEEGGPVEWFQLGLLALACLMCVCGSRRIGRFRELLLLAGLVALFAVVRELDLFFDAAIPVLGWQLPGALVAGSLLWLAWRWREGLSEQLEEFSTLRGFALLWAAFVVAVPFAQLVGHGDFLRAVMGEHYVHDFKRVVEELGETFGYLLLVIGVTESLVQMAILNAAAQIESERSREPTREPAGDGS